MLFATEMTGECHRCRAITTNFHLLYNSKGLPALLNNIFKSFKNTWDAQGKLKKNKRLRKFDLFIGIITLCAHIQPDN